MIQLAADFDLLKDTIACHQGQIMVSFMRSKFTCLLLIFFGKFIISLQWRHNGCNCVSNHQSPNCLFRYKSNKTSKLHVTGLCAGNSPVTGEFPAQMASNTENVSIWWCHHVVSEHGCMYVTMCYSPGICLGGDDTKNSPVITTILVWCWLNEVMWCKFVVLWNCKRGVFGNLHHLCRRNE